MQIINGHILMLSFGVMCLMAGGGLYLWRAAMRDWKELTGQTGNDEIWKSHIDALEAENLRLHALVDESNVLYWVVRQLESMAFGGNFDNLDVDARDADVDNLAGIHEYGYNLALRNAIEVVRVYDFNTTSDNRERG